MARDRTKRLKERSFAELSALSPSESETVLIGDQRVQTCIWRHILPDGRVRIVAQAYRPRFLGIGTMTAEGFIMSSDGSVSDVPEKMMFEFI